MKISALIAPILGRKAPSDRRGSVEIRGLQRGSIQKASNVLVRPTGSFYGKIVARNVAIAGLVRGDVEADTLVIHASGRLNYGTLKCPDVSIERGGVMVKNVEERAEEGEPTAGGDDTVGDGPSDHRPEQSEMDSALQEYERRQHSGGQKPRFHHSY